MGGNQWAIGPRPRHLAVAGTVVILGALWAAFLALWLCCAPLLLLGCGEFVGPRRFARELERSATRDRRLPRYR